MVVPDTSSSPSPVRDSQESSGSRPRTLWTEAETLVLTRLCEEHLPPLRGEKHNAKVYDAIVSALAESGMRHSKDSPAGSDECRQHDTAIQVGSEGERKIGVQQSAGLAKFETRYLPNCGDTYEQ
ncbi:hypothetical protein HPB50_011511 [Hyalomma asiaticum]|uniref:Uncharacterized protein n=1 Tax=Hyalomma asiaticum TaxID=266040 RepID=A0ACB7TIM4_HYAAI|nr:hypothetical protein HPB50_011511 [Hyalomma asiaticum]